MSLAEIVLLSIFITGCAWALHMLISKWVDDRDDWSGGMA